jgi:hypothetical protein
VNRHFKIDRLLTPADLSAYHAFLREPAATVDTAHAWLIGRGYTMVSRSAVARHKRLLLERDEKHARALRSAEAYARLAGAPDAPDLAAGAMLRAEHLMFEKVWDVEPDTDLGERLAELVEVREVMELVASLVRTRRQFDEFKKVLGNLVEPGAAPECRPREPDGPAAANEHRDP